MARNPRVEEEDAARIVTAYLAGAGRPKDPGGGSVPLHDFEVTMADGRVIAVEVTRHTVDAELEARALAARKDWRFRGLRHDWVVKMVGDYSVGELHRRLPPLLEAVDAGGVESLDLKHDDLGGPLQDTFLMLRKLGVRSLYRLSVASGEGGLVTLGSAPAIGATAPNVVVPIVEHHANLADNARKLASAEADERHLFVWVESARHQAVVAMLDDALPQVTPSIPDHIDAVWLATRYEVAQVSAVKSTCRFAYR